MAPVLDTRSVSAADRRDYWTEGIAQHFFPVRLEAVAAPSFEARLAGGDLGPVTVRSIQGLQHRVVRTQQMIAASDPECILLYLLAKGSIHLDQDGRSCFLRHGGIAWQDTSRPSAFEGRDGFEVMVFSVPKWFIGARADRFARRTATRIGGGEGRLTALTTPFLLSLARTVVEGEGLPGREAENAAEMLLSFLRTHEEEEDWTNKATPRTEMLLNRMKRYAMEHLHDPELGPEQIAQAHYVSTRYVHKLFAASGAGVSAWIREQRLEKAAAELRKSPKTPISAVAVKWGYRNPASFSRAFRELHGHAPRDVRLVSPQV